MAEKSRTLDFRFCRYKCRDIMSGWELTLLSDWAKEVPALNKPTLLLEDLHEYTRIISCNRDNEGGIVLSREDLDAVMEHFASGPWYTIILECSDAPMVRFKVGNEFGIEIGNVWAALRDFNPPSMSQFHNVGKQRVLIQTIPGTGGPITCTNPKAWKIIGRPIELQARSEFTPCVSFRKKITRSHLTSSPIHIPRHFVRDYLIYLGRPEKVAVDAVSEVNFTLYETNLKWYGSYGAYLTTNVSAILRNVKVISGDDVYFVMDHTLRDGTIVFLAFKEIE